MNVATFRDIPFPAWADIIPVDFRSKSRVTPRVSQSEKPCATILDADGSLCGHMRKSHDSKRGCCASKLTGAAEGKCVRMKCACHRFTE